MPFNNILNVAYIFEYQFYFRQIAPARHTVSIFPTALPPVAIQKNLLRKFMLIKVIMANPTVAFCT